MQLQGVVYIAHGWCLAMTGEALTRDRPEAMGFGHEYQRLAEALASYGAAPLSRLVSEADTVAGGATAPARANFTKMERGLIASIFSQYADLPASRMAILTKAPGSAWEKSMSTARISVARFHTMTSVRNFSSSWTTFPRRTQTWIDCVISFAPCEEETLSCKSVNIQRCAGSYGTMKSSQFTRAWRG